MLAGKFGIRPHRVFKPHCLLFRTKLSIIMLVPAHELIDLLCRLLDSEHSIEKISCLLEVSKWLLRINQANVIVG